MHVRTGVDRPPRVNAVASRMGRALLLLGALAMLVAPALASAPGAGAQDVSSTRSASNWSPPRTVYIPQTGHTIDGVFLDYWRSWGGASSFGYPITAEVVENGHIVQYYHYARFEYWPEDPNGNVVHRGKLGYELRPHVVLRSAPIASSVGQDRSGAKELAKATRAWLPLDPETAARPNTDTWRYVSETRHSVQHGFKAFWERTGEASFLGNPLTEEYILNGVTYQVFEYGQLAWMPGKEPWMVPVGEVLARRYKLDMSPLPQGNIPTYSEDLFIPPKPPQPKPTGEKWIEVNLSTQYMIAWQGNTRVMESYVSTGRPGFDTPTGTFRILVKFEREDMEGIIGGEYYNVPDVPWVLYFTNVGHAIHGTYWHNNFGYVMSHGCVNLPIDVAEFIYHWAPIGTKVVIHY